MVVHVTRYEADDLNIRTRKTEFLGCWILEAICGYTNEELYSSLTVVRRVVQGVLKHKKFSYSFVCEEYCSCQAYAGR